MSDGPTNTRRDRARAVREATSVPPLKPKVPVILGSDRKNVERQKRALEERRSLARPGRLSSDKGGLSPRGREPRSDDDVAAGVVRLVRAFGRRASTADPDSVRWLLAIQSAVDDCFRDAVAGWRAGGWSDSEIGRQLGVTKQAVQQRWPRA